MWSKRINYLTLVIFVALGLLFYHNYEMMLLMVIVVLLPVISYLLTRKSLDKIEVKVDTDKKHVGKNVTFESIFTVINNSLIPAEDVRIFIKVNNGFYNNEEDYEIIMSSISRRKRETRLKLKGIYCGRIFVKVEKIIFYDIFGMFKFEKQCEVSADTFIMPSKVYKFENIGLSDMGSSSDDEIQSKKGDDPSQISEIRNYIPGDKLKNIHWKLSAKSEELQVKEFSMPYSRDVIIIAETYVDCENPENFDEEIEILYSFCIYILRLGRKYKLVWKNSEFGFTTKEIYNPEDLNSAINDLYFVTTQDRNGQTYELFKSLNSEIKGIVLYISNKSLNNIDGDMINIDSKEVMISCLR